MKERVMLVHNHYRTTQPSGEAQVLEEERSLLRSQGHAVHEYSRFSDEVLNQGSLGIVRAALSTPWNPFTARAIRQEIESFSPDVVHVHNTFPLISPAIFHSVGSRAARVLTLHNYRLFCPAAIPMRGDSVCTECLDKQTAWPAMRYGCYKDSRVATLPLAVSVELHRRLNTWVKKVDAFIALADFQRDLMISAGLPEKLVHVKPNFFPGKPRSLSWDERKSNVVYVGRLSKEKGIESLLLAWKMWGSFAPELRIIGSGELEQDLKQLVTEMPEVRINLMGTLSRSAAQQEIADSRLLVLPSQCFEGFPMVLREAFAYGTPVAVSNIGPLPSIVRDGENGVVFSPADPKSLLDVVRGVWMSEAKLEQLARGARDSYENNYTDTKNYSSLMKIYKQAIKVSRERKTGFDRKN